MFVVRATALVFVYPAATTLVPWMTASAWPGMCGEGGASTYTRGATNGPASGRPGAVTAVTDPPVKVTVTGMFRLATTGFKGSWIVTTGAAG